jgi:hypothetical protein
MLVSQQFHQLVSDVKSHPAISVLVDERRHALERDGSDPGGHAVVAVALILQPCLGESRRGLEEELEGEIVVEAPSGPMRRYEPNMTVDVEGDEVQCRSAILRLIKGRPTPIGR